MSQGEIKIKINGRRCQILVDSGAAFSTLKSILIQQIPWSKKVSIVMVSNTVQRQFLSQPVQMILASFSEKHFLLLCDTVPVHLLGRDLLSKLKGDLTLEFHDQTELNRTAYP